MSCEDVRDLLSLHAEHGLAPELASEVDGHLAACPACASHLAAHQVALAALREEPASGPTDAWLVAAEADRRRARQRTIRVLAAAAALLLIGAAWLSLARRGGTGDASVARLQAQVAMLTERLAEQELRHERDLVRLARAVDEVRGLDRVRLDPGAADDLGPLRTELAARILASAPTIDVSRMATPIAARPVKKNRP